MREKACSLVSAFPLAPFNSILTVVTGSLSNIQYIGLGLENARSSSTRGGGDSADYRRDSAR